MIAATDAPPGGALGISLGVDFLRWRRLALGVEGVATAGILYLGRYDYENSHRDLGLFVTAECDLLDRRRMNVAPVLTVGAGRVKSWIEDEESAEATDGSFAAKAGLGVEFMPRSWGRFRVAVDYLWWKLRALDENGGRPRVNTGGVRLRVGFAIPFLWPWES